MNKAVFLDRDGVLISNKNHYYIWRKSQVEYVDGIFENISNLAEKGFSFFIVSNQGGISKKLYTKSDSIKINKLIIEDFSKKGITIKDVLFCSHHNSVEKCLCRKPSPLMVLRLIARYKLPKENCYFIGDSETDMISAKKAGIIGIKIDSNSNMSNILNQITND